MDRFFPAQQVLQNARQQKSNRLRKLKYWAICSNCAAQPHGNWTVGPGFYHCDLQDLLQGLHCMLCLKRWFVVWATCNPHIRSLEGRRSVFKQTVVDAPYTGQLICDDGYALFSYLYQHSIFICKASHSEFPVRNDFPLKRQCGLTSLGHKSSASTANKGKS